MDLAADVLMCMAYYPNSRGRMSYNVVIISPKDIQYEHGRLPSFMTDTFRYACEHTKFLPENRSTNDNDSANDNDQADHGRSGYKIYCWKTEFDDWRQRVLKALAQEQTSGEDGGIGIFLD
jgi:hypothetical protein